VGKEIRDGYDCGRERREGLMTMGGEVRGNDCGKGNGRMTVVWEGGRGEWLWEGNDCVKGNGRMTV